MFVYFVMSCWGLVRVPEGVVTRKMYTPAKDGTAKPLPSLAQNLRNPTLCGTEIGQNGTLAILAYAYCRQWECPPG